MRRWMRWLVAAGAVMVLLAGDVIVIGALSPIDAIRYRPRGALHPGNQESLRLYNAAPRGSLAGDMGLRREVLSAWRTCKGTSRYRPHPSGFLEVRGQPRILWAGDTPVGRTAIVGQLMRFQHRNKGEYRQDVVEYSFLAAGAANPAHAVVTAGTHPEFGALIGADRSVLVVLDTGAKIGYAEEHNLKDVKQFTPLDFRDGAAIARVSPQPDIPKLLLTRLPYRTETTPLGTTIASDDYIWVADASDFHTHCP